MTSAGGLPARDQVRRHILLVLALALAPALNDIVAVFKRGQ